MSSTDLLAFIIQFYKTILFIVATVIFFLAKYGLKRFDISKQKFRNYISLAISLCAIPMLYYGFIWGFVFSLSYYPKKVFNKQEWIEKTEKRYEMSADIINQKILIGKVSYEVIELLGADYLFKKDGRMTYYLGTIPTFNNIDVDILEIHFENGIVVKVSQYNS